MATLDFAAIFRSSPDIYLLLGPDFTMLDASEARLRATNTTRESLGRNLFEVFPDNPDDPAATGVGNLRRSLERVLRTKQPDTMAVQKYDIPRSEEDGGGFEVRYWSPINTPVLDEKGEVSCIIHRVEDVTEIMRLREQGALLATKNERNEADIIARAQEVQEANRKLEGANAELGRLYQHAQDLAETQSRFFAHVSHELRTPLALILGPVDKLLTAPDLAPDQLRDLRVISRNARTLLRHVNDLLDVVKHRSGSATLSYTKVDLTRVVRLAAAHFDSMSGHRGVRLIVQAAEPIEAEIDVEKIDRILLNLLSNAFKFAPDNGRVICRVFKENDQAVLQVEDNGPGVAPELRDAVFEAFRQGEDVLTRRAGGTGLGLAIVKDFTTLHNGAVSVRDGATGGALFECRIPLKAREGAVVAKNEREAQGLALWNFQQAAEAVAPLPAAVEPGQFDGEDSTPLVLVVEDNPDMRAFIAWTMAKRYRVATAADGREGLTRAAELLPDLVISDMMMPEMTGEELAAAMQDDPTLKDTPVLLLTARADEESRIESLRRGVADFLAKPCSEQELEARAANLIRTKQAGDHARRGRRISEKKYAQVMDQARDGLLVLNGEGVVVSANERAAMLAGRAPGALIGLRLAEGMHIPPSSTLLDDLLTRPVTRLRAVTADGTKIFDASASKAAIEQEDFILVIVRDVTEQALLEESMRRMQKLDALGQLTGGMAHDFNNLLSAITTSLYSLRKRLPDDERTASIVSTMEQSADRGTVLIRRLLTFARNQPMEAETLHLKGLVERQAEMLRNILPSSIKVETRFSPDAWPVHIDQAQFEDGLLNLAINARDAMPAGGVIAIEVANADVQAGAVEGFGPIAPGGYVRVSVSDTGAGMTAETRARVFEPFFTTKEPGKGTGLGLAMVYGLVKQAGGHAAIISAPGEGTRIDMFFPPASNRPKVLRAVSS